jgi:PKD repeat protein
MTVIGADFRAVLPLARPLFAGEYVRLYDPLHDIAGEASIYCVPPAGANRRPVSVSPFLQYVWQTTPTGADVEIDATDSFDPDGDALTFTWERMLDSYSEAPGVGTGSILNIHLEPGIHTFRLIADDGQENVRTYCSVAVIPNDMPVAHPGGPYEVHVYNGITLDGSGSVDPNADCGDSIVRYEWDLNGDGLFDIETTLPAVALTWLEIEALVCGGDVMSDVPYPLVLCVTDSRGGTAIADTTLTIRNDAPVAVDDEYETDEDMPLVVPAPGVLVNDYDPEEDELTAELVNAPLNGELLFNPDGSFTYTPNPDWFGNDSCDYSIGDKIGKKSFAKAYFKVRAVNDPPEILEKPLKVMYNPPEVTLTKSVPWQDKDIPGSDTGNHLAWFSWGDGVTTPGTVIPPESPGLVIGEHAYATCGIFTVTLTLTDPEGASDTSSGLAIISTPPVADAGGIYSTQKGARALLALDAAGSYDPDAGCGDTIELYEWDINGDSVYEFAGAVPTRLLTWDEIETMVCGGGVLIDYPYPIVLRVTDSYGVTDTDTAVLYILNTAPEVGAITLDPPSPLPFGVTVHASAPFTDTNEGDTHTALWDWGDGTKSIGSVTEPTSPGEVDGEHAYTGPGTYTVTVTVSDNDGAAKTESVAVTVQNVPPLISEMKVRNNPEKVGASVQAEATFTDGNPGDAYTAVWNWGDGISTPGTVIPPDSPGLVTGEHAYAEPGVYALSLTLTDAAGESDTAVYEYVVIYDPDGGWISGHGTIDSPPEAYRPDPTLADQARFGFISRYKKGAAVPVGTTRFQFRIADFEFYSDAYEWMVVAGAKAQYKGIGAVNGAGVYRFMLTAVDGDLLGRNKPDTFRIKIWEDATGELIYDNMLGAEDGADPATSVTSGQIIIHK